MTKHILLHPDFSSSTIWSGSKSDCVMYYEREHKQVLVGLKF